MNIPVNNCSSCGACANICVHGAITMQLDKEGFYRPVVDSKKCVNCGLCEKTCPWENEVINPNGSTKAPKTVAAYALDDEIRLQSSSGGIFTVLAEKILDDGGVIVGVAQLASTHCGHIVVDNKADLSKLRGSKYVQADVGTIYKDVRSLLKAGRKVLFSGAPCQVAALYSVLGKKQFENLWTIDIVCHGTPSVKVFEKYVCELKKKTSASVLFSWFRDKGEGWRSFSLKSMLKFDSSEIKFYSRNLREDHFLQIFLRNICLNRSCVDCCYGKLPRIADITLGDYWGVANYHPEMDDDRGTSVVLLNTCHGEKLFAKVLEKIRLCNSTLEKAITGNPCIIRSSKENFRRIEFFDDLDSLSMDELVEKYCASLPLYKIILLKVRNFILKCCR
jgi:coenzyme F420-reducing hydrogenase beta subunit